MVLQKLLNASKEMIKRFPVQFWSIHVNLVQVIELCHTFQIECAFCVDIYCSPSLFSYFDARLNYVARTSAR